MSIPRKEYQNWLEDIEITHKFTNEDGCVCNEIIFTTKNGNIFTPICTFGCAHIYQRYFSVN